MRRRPDGMLEAETFEEHMAPDVEWIEDPEFARAFDALMEEKPMPAHTNDGSNFPGFINVRFDEGKAILTVRGDPKRIDADTDSTEYWKASPTVELTLDQGDWDQLISEAIRERGLVPGG